MPMPNEKPVKSFKEVYESALELFHGIDPYDAILEELKEAHLREIAVFEKFKNDVACLTKHDYILAP